MSEGKDRVILEDWTVDVRGGPVLAALLTLKVSSRCSWKSYHINRFRGGNEIVFFVYAYFFLKNDRS